VNEFYLRENITIPTSQDVVTHLVQGIHHRIHERVTICNDNVINIVETKTGNDPRAAAQDRSDGVIADTSIFLTTPLGISIGIRKDADLSSMTESKDREILEDIANLTSVKITVDIPRYKDPVVEWDNFDLITMAAHVDLFPMGVGVAKNSQPSRAQIKHILRQYTAVHARTPDWIFHMFDCIRRWNSHRENRISVNLAIVWKSTLCMLDGLLRHRFKTSLPCGHS